jgi:hypothetical protein
MVILVHKKGWQADTVQVQPIVTLKYLGYYLDTDLGGDTIQSHITKAHHSAQSHEAQIFGDSRGKVRDEIGCHAAHGPYGTRDQPIGRTHQTLG